MDLGESINPAIDIGQVEGAFIQGYGLFMMEQIVHSPSGALITRGPGAYKIPSFNDIPGILKKVETKSKVTKQNIIFKLLEKFKYICRRIQCITSTWSAQPQSCLLQQGCWRATTLPGLKRVLSSQGEIL